jgi:hypothetical protein
LQNGETALLGEGIPKVKATRGDLDRNTSISIEALRFTNTLCNLAFSDLRAALSRIEKLEENPDLQTTLRIFSFCWQIVDTTHRSRELCTKIPGLKHKTPELQLFLRATKSVEKFRHAYQHLATDIPKRPVASQPSMGSFGWITEKDLRSSITIWLGGGYSEQQAYGLTFDRAKNVFAQDFLLSVGNSDLRIDLVAKAVNEFSSFFETWLDAEQLLGDNDIVSSKQHFRVQIRS